MSLHPLAVYLIPDDTARVAHAAFPKGNTYLALRDELGPIFEDRAFAALFSARGRAALAPAQLALVTILQFAEGLSAVQAADAVRGRIDWKYLLSLELDDPGFDASVLCEFRARLLAGGQETRLLDTLLTLCRERGLLKAGGRQRTDSTHVLAAVRARNRLELVGETMRHARNSFAVAVPAWLRAQAHPAWADRYARRTEDARLPAKQAAREALALTIGADDYVLLAARFAADAPAWLREIPAVETLRRVWVQQYHRDEAAIRWRPSEELPPSSRFISSPHDGDAHYAKKRTTQWVGYKVHVTETCDDDTPQLITGGHHRRPHRRWCRHPGHPCRAQGTRPAAPNPPCGYRVPRCGVTRHQSGGVRGRTPGADARRLPLASARGHRLRHRRFPDRLGPGMRRLPGGAHQHQLDAGGRQAHQSGRQDHVLRARLSPLPQPRAMHTLGKAVPAPYHHDPGTR